jgi:hypothetical protein
MLKSIASSSPASRPSSPEHIAIDIDPPNAGPRTDRRLVDSPLAPFASSSPADRTGVSTTAPRSATTAKLQGLQTGGSQDEIASDGSRGNASTRASQVSSPDHIAIDIEQLAAAHGIDKAHVLGETLPSVDDLRLPSVMGGTVARGSDAKLRSSDRFVNAVLKFVEAKFPGELDKLDLPKGTRLSLPLEKSILVNARLFEQGCKVQHIDVLGAEEPLPVNIDLSSYSARQAIRKGASGFADGARLNLDARQLRSGSAQPGEASTSEHAASDGRPAELHPFEFLKGTKYEVETDHPGLKRLIENALNDEEPATLELRARLGAHSINTVLNQKTLDWKLLAAMALSLGGSTLIAYLLDVKAVTAIVGKVGKKLGKDSTATRFVEAFAASTVPSPAEFSDSMFVKRIIERFRGNSLLPESMDEVKDDVKDSAVSGLIAALGSIPSNLVQVTRKGGAIAGNVVTNVLATATSAAMAPMEVAKAREQMIAAVIQQRSAGFFPASEASVASSPDVTPAQALVKEVGHEIQGALEVTRGVGDTINSMGIGQVLSLAAFAPVTALARAHMISQMMQKVAMIAVNTPTEVLSLGTGILTGKYVGGLGGLLTTDQEKNRRIAELIVNKTIERLHNAAAGNGDATVPISEAELRAIEHPPLELTFPVGKGIVNAMNGTIDFFAEIAAKARGTPREPSLAEKAAQAATRPALEE